MQKRSSIKLIKISDFLKCNNSYAVLEVEKKKCQYSPNPPPPFLFNYLFIYLFILNK